MKRGTPDHPKTAALARALGVHRVAAIGTLELLWHWTARYAARGDIGRYPDESIAEAVLWDGDPVALIRALVAARWVDECAEHRLIVHDWAQHADDSTKKALSRNGLSFAAVVSRQKPDMSGQNPPQSGLVAPAVAVPLPEPLPEPEPQAATPTTDDRLSESHGLSVPLPELSLYGARIVEDWHRLRGSDFPQPSNKDFLQLSTWHASGIPPAIVERGLKDCIEGMVKRKDKPAGKPLAYFHSSVKVAYEQWRGRIA